MLAVIDSPTIIATTEDGRRTGAGKFNKLSETLSVYALYQCAPQWLIGARLVDGRARRQRRRCYRRSVFVFSLLLCGAVLPARLTICCRCSDVEAALSVPPYPPVFVSATLCYPFLLSLSAALDRHSGGFSWTILFRVKCLGLRSAGRRWLLAAAIQFGKHTLF